MSTIEINIKGIDNFQKKIRSLKERIKDDIDGMLNVSSEDIATEARQLAPVDEGLLRSAINTNNAKFLEKHITVNAPHAAFMEFGTGHYAQQYLATLPLEWQQFASQFHGQKGGTFAEMVLALTEWVHRHSIHPETAITGTFSRKTRRRTGNKKVQQNQDRQQLAYGIAIKILKNGLRPRPYLYPAYINNVPKIIDNATKILNSL